MAVIQYTGLVAQIRGKVNGSVLSKFKSGFSFYKKANPSQFGSETQQQVRSFFAAFAGTWRTLTGSQRADWNFIANSTPLYNRLGELRTISGYAYFIKFNQFLRDAGLGILIDIATDLAPAYSVSLVTSNFFASPGSSRFVIDQVDVAITTLSDSDGPNIAILYASQPSPYPDFKYFGTWYRVAVLNLSAAEGVGHVFNFELSNIEMPQGWRVFDNGVTLFRVDCVNLESAQWSPGATNEEPVIIPPVTFFPRLLAPEPIEGENEIYRFEGSIWWTLYWNRQNPQSNPLLFEIEISVAFSNTDLAGAPALSYNFMILTPITLLFSPDAFQYSGSTSGFGAGPAVESAFGGTMPTPITGWLVWQRYRTRLLTGGPWSTYNYQGFGWIGSI